MKQYVIAYKTTATGVVHINAPDEVHARRFAEFRFNPHYLTLTDAEICSESESDGEGRLVGALSGHSTGDWQMAFLAVEAVPPGSEASAEDSAEDGGPDPVRLLPAERDVRMPKALVTQTGNDEEPAGG